jgi:hypothetical protein
MAIASRTRSGGRLLSTIVLCRCGCHDGCSLTGWAHVPLTAWQELCECPGAAFQRTWKEDIEDPWPGAREQRERQRRDAKERKHAHNEAFQAVLTSARGKTRREAVVHRQTARSVPAYMSSTMSVLGREQQMSTCPPVGGSSGSGL